jgi:hypothetical protein
MKSGTNRRDKILGYLEERGGAVVSDDGRGLTAAIAAAVGYDDLPTLNGMLARLERDGAIEREVRGKRTYRIALAKAGARRARRTTPARTVAPQPVADAGPSVADLKQTLALLEARVAELESQARSTSKRRRWRAS